MPSLGIFKLLIWLRVIQTSIIYKELMLLVFFLVFSMQYLFWMLYLMIKENNNILLQWFFIMQWFTIFQNMWIWY